MNRIMNFLCTLFAPKPLYELHNIDLSFNPCGSERRIRPYKYAKFYWEQVRFTHGSCIGDENETLDMTFYCDNDDHAEGFLNKICHEHSWCFHNNMPIRVYGDTFPEQGIRGTLIGLGAKRLPDKPLLIRIVLHYEGIWEGAWMDKFEESG